MLEMMTYRFGVLLTFDHQGIKSLPNEIIGIPLYGLFIMLGVVMALGLGLLEGPKIGLKNNDIIDGLLIILPLSILGARIWYVIFEWERFKDFLPSIIGIVQTDEGLGFSGLSGLAIHGGFFVAVIASWIYTKKRKIDFMKATDLIAPGFLIAQASGRWGNFFNQEAHGGPITGVASETLSLAERPELWDTQRAFLSNTLRLPDFITNNMFIFDREFGSNYFHPTFLYESLWNVLGFVFVLILRRLKFTRSGDLIGFYLIWYSIGRFFIESLRTDSLYLWNTGIRTAQVVSILMILAGIILIIFNHKIIKRKHYVTVLAEDGVKS